MIVTIIGMAAVTEIVTSGARTTSGDRVFRTAVPERVMMEMRRQPVLS